MGSESRSQFRSWLSFKYPICGGVPYTAPHQSLVCWFISIPHRCPHSLCSSWKLFTGVKWNWCKWWEIWKLSSHIVKRFNTHQKIFPGCWSVISSCMNEERIPSVFNLTLAFFHAGNTPSNIRWSYRSFKIYIIRIKL